MGLKKPKKKNTHKVIDVDHPSSGPSSSRKVSVVVQNYYEAGPSGVEWTDRVVDVEEYDNPRPTKIPRVHSPPLASTKPSTSLAQRDPDLHAVPSLSAGTSNSQCLSSSGPHHKDFPVDLTDAAHGIPPTSASSALPDPVSRPGAQTSDHSGAQKKKKVS